MENSSKIFPEIHINKSFNDRSTNINQTMFVPSCHIPSETEKELRQQLAFWLGTQWAKNENIIGRFTDILQDSPKG